MSEKATVCINQDLELEFMEIDPYDGMIDEESGEYTLTHDEILEKMEEALPEEASLIEFLDTDIDSFCMSWAQEEHFYIMPWKANDEFDWIVFRISWDDNWSKWEWASGAKVSGIKEESDAANFAISHLFDHWSCDVTKEDYQVYAEF